MKILLSFPVLGLILFSSFANALEGKLTLSQIYDLKNPYAEKALTEQEPIEGSDSYIQLRALDDRFEKCQKSGMIVYIASASHMAAFAKAGFPMTEAEGVESMAMSAGLDFPFDMEDISYNVGKRVDKLAIETGVKYPGSSDGHLENIASIFWEKCINLPIDLFEKNWR